MSDRATIDILKEAILLEKRGQAFYRKVADQAENQEVKTFFETMAEEEVRHVEILERQFSSFTKDKRFLQIETMQEAEEQVSQFVLSRQVKQQIAAADFEAAAISAAMLMEERAVSLYGKNAETAKDPAEKALYRWLADWERGHLSFLARLDKEIKETIWNNNQFWPY